MAAEPNSFPLELFKNAWTKHIAFRDRIGALPKPNGGVFWRIS